MSTQPNPSDLPACLSPEAVDRSIRAWLDLVDSTELLVLAGFQQRLGPEQAQAAYRAWCREQSQRHFEHLVELAGRLQSAGA